MYNPNTPTNTVPLASDNPVVTSDLDQAFYINGRILMSTTLGNIAFRWAQNVSTASNTIVYKGSTLIVWEELP